MMPFQRVHRHFRELDHLSDAECERYVRDAWINGPTWLGRLPFWSASSVAILWLGGWITASVLLPISNWVPIPSSLEWQIALLCITAIFVTWLTRRVVRDVALWFGIRREVRRSNCPKCGQSLTGLPIRTQGLNYDPASQFVRCPECGREFCLLDIGLTPRDLVPFEQRGIDAKIATLKPR